MVDSLYFYISAYNGYFSSFRIYGVEGEIDAIEVLLEVLQLSSMLKAMIEDLGGSTEQAIPFGKSSIATLRALVLMVTIYY